MTTQQNHTHRRQRHEAPFGRFIEEILGDTLENIFITNRAPVNILESENAVEVHVAAPGLNKSDFKLEVKEGHLHISAARTASQPEGTEFRSREFDFSNFHRTFRLDERVDHNKISAKYENGILVVSIQKRAKETWKREIHVD